MSDCSICFEPVTDETGRAVMSCKHEFHMRCLVQWLQKPDGTATCPCCRHAPTPMEQLVPPPSDSDSEDEDEDEDEDEAETTNTTPLMKAAEESRIADIRRMLSAGANVNEVDPNGDTALTYAVVNNKHEATAVLLEAGADVRALAYYHSRIWDFDPLYRKYCSNARANLALFVACKFGSLSCASAAIEAGANINCRLSSGRTPLMASFTLEAVPELVKFLVSLGADIYARDEDGWNAFMWFAKECHGGRSVNDLETMAALLEAMGARTKQWVITYTYDGGLWPKTAAEIIQDAWRDYSKRMKANAKAKARAEYLKECVADQEIVFRHIRSCY